MKMSQFDLVSTPFHNYTLQSSSGKATMCHRFSFFALFTQEHVIIAQAIILCYQFNSAFTDTWEAF